MPSAFYDYMTAPVIAGALFLSAFVIIPNVSYVNLSNGLVFAYRFIKHVEVPILFEPPSYFIKGRGRLKPSINCRVTRFLKREQSQFFFLDARRFRRRPGIAMYPKRGARR